MKSLANKKILVTGAAGFIGSHLTEELARIGAKVRAYVHYNSRNDWGNIELLDKGLIHRQATAMLAMFATIMLIVIGGGYLQVQRLSRHAKAMEWREVEKIKRLLNMSRLLACCKVLLLPNSKILVL